jgi:hypothetical protein
MIAIVNIMKSVPKGTVGIYDEIVRTWRVPEHQIIELGNGYKVLSIRSKAKGRCVEHEIDLAVTKEGIRVMVECKYHNSAGTFTGLKESM